MLGGLGFGDRLSELGTRPVVLAMSAWPVSSEDLQAMGTASFIAKPFDLDELVREVRTRAQDQATVGEDESKTEILSTTELDGPSPVSRGSIPDC